MNQARLIIFLALTSVLITACTSSPQQEQAIPDAVDCHIVYDGGSSATRLFVYEKTATGWLTHRGPKTAALSDPVRGIRGKSMSDANVLIRDILLMLDFMRRDGPPGKNGEPQWTAFDWQQHCDTKAAAVYATAGMRLAEKQDAGNSALLWSMLNDRLSKKLGVKVTTRTLTEYEEGLFSWLALRESRDDGNFAVAEMGGASLQVTMPCSFCEVAPKVKVKGGIVAIFGHSFLGWGQDEAWRKFGGSPACSRGAALKVSDWQVGDCEPAIVGFTRAAAEVTAIIKDSGHLKWYLTSAFSYMKNTDIENFCRKGINSGYEPESSCFRAIYLENVLETLTIPSGSELSDVNWTLGAVVCSATRCLETH